MALSLIWNQNLIRTTTSPCTVLRQNQNQKQRGFSVSVRARGGEERHNVKRVWRRRKLNRKDERVHWDEGRALFLEEQVNKARESDKHICFDIDMLLLSEENRFDFVNEVIAEANELLDKDEDAYGSKKPIYHALTNRINGMGYDCPEAYLQPDPYCNKLHSSHHQPFFI
ncbi:Plastid transcriptionally active 7 [Rhynchospora pubera]|uniref:Plastid transcriptionally active 7 n=1 Tax=Rhynchospora pubera TaxID=906938 RepID=A0AAV8EH67_9POAL|nr:Plastid transcriptionally active 7 [Rhynchospora pubera]